MYARGVHPLDTVGSAIKRRSCLVPEFNNKVTGVGRQWCRYVLSPKMEFLMGIPWPFLTEWFSMR